MISIFSQRLFCLYPNLWRVLCSGSLLYSIICWNLGLELCIYLIQIGALFVTFHFDQNRLVTYAKIILFNRTFDNLVSSAFCIWSEKRLVFCYLCVHKFYVTISSQFCFQQSTGIILYLQNLEIIVSQLDNSIRM